MKNIKVKLSVSDYKYLCLLAKQCIDAVKEYDTPIAYCTNELMSGEYQKLIKKLPKLKKGKSITACVSFSLYSLLFSFTKAGMEQHKFDAGNLVLINDLFRLLDEGIKAIQMEENMITDIVL